MLNGISTSQVNTSAGDYDVRAGEVVFLYLHGNTNTRAAHHRMELYKILQQLGFHVLAVDYRGFADSSFIWRPNELTLAHDAFSAYHWLLERSHPEARIFVWGHSLGSGVTSKLGMLLSKGEGALPTGFVLEAPFSSLYDEITSFYASRFLPFDILHQVNLIRSSNSTFQSFIRFVPGKLWLVAHCPKFKSILSRCNGPCSYVFLYSMLIMICVLRANACRRCC